MRVLLLSSCSLNHFELNKQQLFFKAFILQACLGQLRFCSTFNIREINKISNRVTSLNANDAYFSPLKNILNI